MVRRKYWLKLIEDAWKRRSLIWLSGVRRSGKTFLCRSIEKALYFDCELPSTRRMMEDPEGFLEKHKGKRLIIDEVHKLTNPSELLKIAADYTPETKIIATGSSTLTASTKFKDTLTGRKADLWLPPMIYEDMEEFGNTDIRHRLGSGGLPPFFLSEAPLENEYQEWIDAYWSKDIQELFRVEKRSSFVKYFEMILKNSGCIFEANSYASPCEVSRATIINYLRILEESFVVHILRPFNSGKTSEIISAPKIYAFDTGFIKIFRGWERLRDDDLGILWEHFALNCILSKCIRKNVYYWRSKSRHEVDFVIIRGRGSVDAVECKWSSSRFDIKNIKSFRNSYSSGKNIVLANDVRHAYLKYYGNIKVEFRNINNIFDKD